jgi:hypothetical protein
MSEPAEPLKARTESALAERIFIELVGRNVTIADGAVKMSGSAENYAKLSFKLAEVFLSTDLDARAAEMPKNPGYKLGSEDVAAWMK